jgi:hypothetical protein
MQHGFGTSTDVHIHGQSAMLAMGSEDTVALSAVPRGNGPLLLALQGRRLQANGVSVATGKHLLQPA